MTRPGEVTEVRNGMMRITFCRPEACAKCGACEGGKKEHHLWVQGSAQIGDIAVVDMPEKMIVGASLIAYGLPLVGLVVGMILGNVLAGGKDAGTIIGAAIGLALSLAALKMTEKNRRGKPEWTPRVVNVFPKKVSGEQEREKAESGHETI